MKFPMQLDSRQPSSAYTGRPRVASEILIFTGLAGMFSAPLQKIYGSECFTGSIRVVFSAGNYKLVVILQFRAS